MRAACHGKGSGASGADSGGLGHQPGTNRDTQLDHRARCGPRGVRTSWQRSGGQTRATQPADISTRQTLPVERNFSQWAYWRLRHDLTPEPSLPPDGVDETWRTSVRVNLTDALGTWPEPVDPRLEVSDAVQEPYGHRRRVVFDTEQHMSVPAWLLEPTEPRPGRPAVVVVHGHGLDKDRVCGVVEPPDPGLDYGRQLAAAGLTVLAPDLRGFGERADGMLLAEPTDDLVENIVRHQADCGWDLVCATLTGTTPLTLNLWDLRRCVDVLGQLPGTPVGSIGTAGWSYGGTLALLLAALDERISATVVSGYFSSWRAAHRTPWNLCGRQVLPGLIGTLEHTDIAALIAPRPLFIESGRDDTLFPVDAATASVEGTRSLYRSLGADPADVVHEVFAGGHEWQGDAAEAFLLEHLTD